MNQSITFARLPSQAALLLLAATCTLLSSCSSDLQESPSNGGSSGASIPPQQFIALAQTCGSAGISEALEVSCSTPDAIDGHEPVCNPSLSQSGWSGAHRANYAQDSSPLPGVDPALGAIGKTHRQLFTPAAPIIMPFSDPDTAGHRALWATTVGYSRKILKLDAASMRVIDTLPLPSGSASASSTTGAYNLLDRDQHLIVGSANALHVYGDAVSGDRLSGISMLKDFQLPASALCRSDDEVVGITMLPDGYVGFATKYGMIGVVPRFPEAMCGASTVSYSINGSACADSSIASDQLEQVSNSIAADENSNLYVVTSNAQYRFDWDGSRLSQHWRSPYPGAGGSAAGRLGAGSGSTPTLMGTAAGDDRFVVITDGESLMHLILMWRDDIPADWQALSPDLDRRIACNVPLDFGDPTTTQSMSEQSVVVRGYGAVVVNNLLQHNDVLSQLPDQFVQLASGKSAVRPYGIERVDWNPQTRRCQVTWTNPDLSFPNGIPTISAASGMVYGVGARTIDGADQWTLEGVDFASGASRFYIAAGRYDTENSIYAALQVGPDSSLWTGTLSGITRYQQCSASADNCGPESGIVTPVMTRSTR